MLTDFGVLESGALPHRSSAQVAELYALVRTWTISKDESATINADSHDASGAAQTERILKHRVENERSKMLMPLACHY